MNVIELRRVLHSYPGGDAAAVDGLDLTVSEGEIMVLLGPSGCGKTTVLRLIAGFERPTGGSVILRGRVVAGPGTWVPPHIRGVGMVFQDPALLPHLNVEGNVAFGLRGRPGRRQVVDRHLELVGLAGLGHRMPDQLSGGQKQRVALARALAPDPVVLLLDEPFSSLDAGLREDMRDEIRTILKRSRTTALMVTHDRQEALAVADRVAVMRAGRIEQVGSPRQVYSRPHSAFVATFLGRTNILSGRVAPGREAVITDVGPVPLPPGLPPREGEEVTLSVRPDSLERDPDGPVHGLLDEVTYRGPVVDAVLVVMTAAGTRRLLVHLHPEDRVGRGQECRFRFRPDFVAVVAVAGDAGRG